MCFFINCFKQNQDGERWGTLWNGLAIFYMKHLMDRFICVHLESALEELGEKADEAGTKG